MTEDYKRDLERLVVFIGRVKRRKHRHVDGIDVADIITERIEEVLQRREKKIMPTTYKLLLKCPECGKKSGTRLVVEDEEIRAICIACEKYDEEVSIENLVSTICATVQLADEKGALEREELQDLVVEKLELEAEED